MIRLDGGMGEGGGQILRTALALSMVTGYRAVAYAGAGLYVVVWWLYRGRRTA